MKRALSLTLLLILISGLTAIDSDEFIIGCYAYLKARPYNSAFNDSMIVKLKNAHFNAAIWETDESPVDGPLLKTNAMIRKMKDNGITSYIIDYDSQYDIGGTLIRAGAHTMSVANNWRFEAEFDSIEPVRKDDANDSYYFYRFNLPQRTGISDFERKASHDVSWLCRPQKDQPGIIMSNLQYRWPEAQPGLDVNSGDKYPRFDFEFIFPFFDNSSDTLYLKFNKLYVSYSYKLGKSKKPDQLALTFGCRFKRGNGGDFVFMPLRHEPSGISGDSLSFTYAQLASADYSSQVKGSKYRTITFSIDMIDLLNHGMVDTSRYWFCNLYGLDPYLYWHGEVPVSIDYVEVKDRLQRLLAENTDLGQEVLSRRLKQYSDQLPEIGGFYLLDEPQQPQLSANRLVMGYLTKHGKLGITTFSAHNSRLQKPDKSRFSIPSLYLDRFSPTELMVDYYPLEPDDSWNSAAVDAMSEVSNSSTHDMQWLMDWRMLSHYRELKRKCDAKKIPFYAVAISGGQWNASDKRWTKFQLPTPAMQNCLQMLPLCYGVSGIFDYPLYNRINPDLDNPERYVGGEDLLQWFGLLDVYGDIYSDNFRIEHTNHYNTIAEANRKLEIYGPVLKNLIWLDACTLNRNGMFLPGNIYDSAINKKVNNYLTLLSACDPQYGADDYKNPYEGYVQAGFFEDRNANPYYMLVNRRTDFLTNADNPQKISPFELRSGKGYFSAAPQNVSFVINDAAIKRFGTTPALYDRFDRSLHVSDGRNIELSLKAGEGKMLEMVGSLPDRVTANHVISSKGLIKGDIIISDQAQVLLDSNADVILNPGTMIIVTDNSSLVINGTLTQQENCCITTDSGGRIIINGKASK